MNDEIRYILELSRAVQAEFFDEIHRRIIMSDLETKKEQCLKDIKALQENLKDIEFAIEAEIEEKSKSRGFSVWKFMARQNVDGSYTIACRDGNTNLKKEGYYGSEAFNEEDIKYIIGSLRELIGDTK